MIKYELWLVTASRTEYVTKFSFQFNNDLYAFIYVNYFQTIISISRFNEISFRRGTVADSYGLTVNRGVTLISHSFGCPVVKIIDLI